MNLSTSRHILMANHSANALREWEIVAQSKRVKYEILKVENYTELLVGLQNENLDLLLLDKNILQGDGIDQLEYIYNLLPPPPIVLAGLPIHEQVIEQYYNLGVYGFLQENPSHEELNAAISTVLQERKYFSPAFEAALKIHLTAGIRFEAPAPVFSATEKDVLLLICRGKNEEEIGRMLMLGTVALSRVLKQLYSKTDSDSVADLVLFAFGNGYCYQKTI